MEIVRIKMGWKHYQTVDPRKGEPQVARVLFGIRLLILHFKFHQIFNISYFPQFKEGVNVNLSEILVSLKRG